MTESVIELYDEKVFGDEIPDAALEIAGSKWGMALRLYRRILLWIGHLPVLTLEIKATYIAGPFIFPTRRQATGRPAIKKFGFDQKFIQ